MLVFLNIVMVMALVAVAVAVAAMLFQPGRRRPVHGQCDYSHTRLWLNHALLFPIVKVAMARNPLNNGSVRESINPRPVSIRGPP